MWEFRAPTVIFAHRLRHWLKVDLLVSIRPWGMYPIHSINGGAPAEHVNYGEPLDSRDLQEHELFVSQGCPRDRMGASRGTFRLR
jgi:hypothetical protein